MLPLIIPLSLWYGAGAVLIREVTRRIGRGWPTMLMLGFAFGIVEEGLLTMSLFNPDYAGLRLLDPGHVSALGIGIPWTIFVLTLHPLWSVAAPIALMEETQRDRRTTPWLGDRGLTAIGVCVALGAVVTFASNYPLYGHFVASLPQLISSAPRPSQGSAPRPRIAFAVTVVGAGAFQVGGHSDSTWISTAAMLISLAALAASIAQWSRSVEWGAPHRFAVAAALVLTYAWRAFFGGYGHSTAELAVSVTSYVVYAVAAVVILLLCANRIGSRHGALLLV